MRRLTANNLVAFINKLPKNQSYHYVSDKNHGQIKIVSIDSDLGPIRIKRWDSSKKKLEETAKIESISTEMLWRVANAFIPSQPTNIDRVLGASYNTRSVLEALLAHTPEFYVCYPGRIESVGGQSRVKKGHKHLIWEPSKPHTKGIKEEVKTTLAVSEMPNIDAFYDPIIITIGSKDNELDIAIKRRHAQIQVALYCIGNQLGYNTWIARNDIGIEYNEKKLFEHPGVLSSLDEGTVIRGREEAIKAAKLIDCIWFKNGRLMPAVMEIEQSTGVTSGLNRMKKLQDLIPGERTRYVIVAPDEDREKVIKEIKTEHFKSLNAQFFPYSSVEELYALCTRRKLKGINDEFLDCYMESVLESA